MAARYVYGGCISHKGIGFQNIYTGRINQYNYKETLEIKLTY